MNGPDTETPRLALLAGLAFDCQRGEPRDCTLQSKRKLSFVERFDWIQSLSDAEVLAMFTNHCGCLKNKAYLP